MKRVFLACALALAFGLPAFAADDKKLDAPPAGITPTTVSLAQILKNYSAATGRLVHSAVNTRQETWSFTKAGLNGTETLLRSASSDYRSHIVTGPLSEDYGQFFGHAWHRDANGVVSPVESPDYTSFQMLLFMRNMDEAADPKNDVTVLGEVQSPKPAYVLQIKTTGAKHPDFAFYDKQTGLIDRFDYVLDGERATLTYDDYRTTSGLTQPWHVHATNGIAALDFDFVRKSLTIGVPVDVKQFAAPPSTSAFEYFNGHQSLPVKVFRDFWRLDVGDNHYQLVQAPTLVVRLNVAGRGLDFAVSAAQPHSLIDFDVAQELQLSPYGQATHADGKDVSYDTVIPQADIGTGLLLRNWVVRATPFHYHLNGETKVVGMIGYDVLSAGVFKIDYINHTFDVYPAKTFDGDQPAEVKDAYELPVTFDNGRPFFAGTIDSHQTPNILFDNDFDTSFIFGDFTTRYPDSVKDVVTGKSHGTAMIPFADSKGYGREVHIWLGNVPDIHFGPAHFVNFRIVASDGDTSLDGHDVDALMGGDLLQFYDIYLDYPHSRIFLRPNKAFFDAFKVEPGA